MHCGAFQWARRGEERYSRWWRFVQQTGHSGLLLLTKSTGRPSVAVIKGVGSGSDKGGAGLAVTKEAGLAVTKRVGSSWNPSLLIQNKTMSCSRKVKRVVLSFKILFSGANAMKPGLARR